jgi:hypothetical protein
VIALSKGAIGECFRAVERHRLDRMLAGAAYVAAATEDVEEYQRHCRNVGILTANAEARCVIGHDEADELRKDWVRGWAELRLYALPPHERCKALVNPDDGPQRFLSLRRRLQMLREIDKAA